MAGTDKSFMTLWRDAESKVAARKCTETKKKRRRKTIRVVLCVHKGSYAVNLCLPGGLPLFVVVVTE